MQGRLGHNLFAADKVNLHPLAVAVVVGQLQAAHLFAQPQGHAVLAQVIGQGVNDFRVHKRQEAVALVNQRDAHAEGGEDAGVFATDDARADDGEGARQAAEFEDVVADQDVLAVEGGVWVFGGNGSGGDDGDAGSYVTLAAPVHVVQADGV